MAGHEADLVIAGDPAQQVEQVGKVDGVFQPFAVAVDVLPQQGDLLVTGLHQAAELGQDRVGFTAALPPADVGHDAVGAEVVAAVHDGQPGPEAGVPPDGQVLHHRVAGAGLLQIPPALAEPLGQHGGQAVDAVHPEHQVHIGVAAAQFVHDAGLLGHAAADPDDQLRVAGLELFEGAHIAEDPLLGMFPHGAGVEKDQVGLFQGVGQAEAHVLQHAADLFAVVDVLLAAEAVDISHGRRVRVGGGDHRRGGRVMGVGEFFQGCPLRVL